jgi:CDP-6-deoxy-D-xylo-4-hexulose-3-dehydrase
LEDLSNAISEKTKVILAVNLLGNPNDFDRINEIIGKKDILLLEDNCESMGAKYKNKYTGSFGLMGTFSTFFSHHISTMEGGVVITDNEELYHIMLSLRAHGWTRNLPQINQISNKVNNDFIESFRFLLPGYNLRPIEMSGAIGIEQLKKLPKFIEQRRKNAVLFTTLFEDDKRFTIQKEIEDSSWFGFSFIIKNNISRDSIIQKLNKANIDVRPIVTGDFTKNKVMDYFDYSINSNLDNSKYLEINGFFIGNSHEDLTKELNYLKSIL